MANLLEPITIGGKLPLRNRIVMGSMTRNRCIDNNKPGRSQIKYYADRAKYGTGLIITEGIFVDWTGCDWKHAPFMFTQDHADAWRKVTDANGAKVLAPSAIKAHGGKYRELPGTPGHTDNIEAITDVQAVVDTYRRSCELAKTAGFDGVELLAQGGYLPQQFLSSRANHRTDEYGGSVENRCRFTLELVNAIAAVFKGPEHICVKINPTDHLNDSVVDFDEMKETYTYLITELVKRQVGIINLGRRGAETSPGSGEFFGPLPRPGGYPLPRGYDPVLDFGKLVKFPGSPTLLMANHDYTVEAADALAGADKLDMITFARAFIWNPDLIPRIIHGLPLAENDRGPWVFYGLEETEDKGYNDWPVASTA
ncbi:flavo nadh-dependent oxidoreductase [Fusarium acutatum]|uniref:Flavo nadh-dependent oxidoreductase n=1 Tax=Fusarium acutatum TaxID=78861 RepID=A0A8H4JNC6_9HYPO|nr:flavo nadh-dependent oxidoreductase [Fusarium acutatum]